MRANQVIYLRTCFEKSQHQPLSEVLTLAFLHIWAHYIVEEYPPPLQAERSRYVPLYTHKIEGKYDQQLALCNYVVIVCAFD